jgi:serine/threonine protein kinase
MDKYRVLQVLGDGSFGTVKKAQVKGTKDMVAIKKLKKDLIPGKIVLSCQKLL